MKRFQVLIVTRRYWPHCDDASSRLTALVSGLRRQGCYPTVLTPRYQATWPAEFQHREIPVLRPLAAPRGEWSMARYVRNLGKWLREQLPRFDLVYCDMMREEAAAVVETARQVGVPSVVRCGTLMGTQDIVWQASLRARRNTFVRSFAADAVIAPRASCQQALLVAGAKAATIVRIADGIGDPIRRTPESCKAARLTLGNMNHDLMVPVDGKVILCMNRLSPEGGVLTLASALWPLLEAQPDLRLWMIGDGPWRQKIFNDLKHNGVGRAAFLPGNFDHVEELMQAADMFVLPSAASGAESFWPAAIAAALPSAVVDCADTRAFAMAAFSELHSFPADSTDKMREAVQNVLDDLPMAAAGAQRMRSQLSTAASFSDTIRRHVQLFERLAGNSSAKNVSGATG
ncbi:glycosyltransferase family 4 protein [Rosistilla oblonga]|uniref:glycosyltransferase family 4 protein n=1 Tax=Rosistilla oblonga TaxID=2527990 RepID=UPI003A96B817